MAQTNIGSPIAAILDRASRLRLTPEQQAQLRRLSLDFEAEAARLTGEQRLLEIEARRENIPKGIPLSFTSKQLALIDEKTAKLRLAWLVTLEEATAVLSPEQQVKVQSNIDSLPNFEGGARANVEELDMRVAKAVNAQLKDAKALEIETAQAIADRLIGWGKVFTIAVGVPLTIGGVVLGFLGYHTYSDFTTSVSSAEQNALEKINKAAAQNTQEFKDRATNLRAGYEKLEKQLAETEALPAKFQELKTRVENLEQIEIKGSVSTDAKSAIQERIGKFRDYVALLGYKMPGGKVNVIFDKSYAANAYYDPEDNSIKVDPKLFDDYQAMYRDYTHRSLAQINPMPPKIIDNVVVMAIESALADYFPCSYLGTPKFDEKFLQVYPQAFPPATVKQGYLRSLANDLKFVSSEETDKDKTEPHKAGEPWAGAFWEIRSVLGCQPNVPQCERADKMVLAAWASSWLDGPPKMVGQRFAEAIIAAAGSSGTPKEVEKIRSVFERRGLKLPK